MIDPELLRRMAAAISMASELAVTVTLGVLAGAWLDRRFDTAPTFLLALSLLGLAIGTTHLVRGVQEFWSSDDGDPPDDRR